MHRDVSILVLGAAVDADTIDLLTRVDRIPQVQTYRFQWAIIHALDQAFGRPVSVLATVPTRDWPFTRKIWFSGRRSSRQADRQQQAVLDQQITSQPLSDAVSKNANAFSETAATAEWIQMPMINLLGLKQLWRFLTSFWHLAGWLRRHRRSSNRVIVSYGLIVPHLCAAQILARVVGAKVVAILTDPPLTYHDEGLLHRLARAFDRALLRSSLHRLDGAIVLTPKLAEFLSPVAPSLVVEGMISDDVRKYAGAGCSHASGSAAAETGFVIMYAGQLHNDYGVGVILNAFEKLQGEQWSLWLYGSGTLEPRIKQVAASDPRVKFFGFQPADVVFPAMRRADVMISPRPVDDRIAPYSFPSKIIEYLAMGKIVIATKLPSIPAEYYPHLVFFDSMSASDLADKIRQVAASSADERKQMEERCRAFAWAGKTQLQQGERMADFLASIIKQDTQ